MIKSSDYCSWSPGGGRQRGSELTTCEPQLSIHTMQNENDDVYCEVRCRVGENSVAGATFWIEWLSGNTTYLIWLRSEDTQIQTIVNASLISVWRGEHALSSLYLFVWNDDPNTIVINNKYIAISISVPSDKFCEKIRHYLYQVQVKCVFNIHIFTLFPPFQVFFRSASVTNSKLTL